MSMFYHYDFGYCETFIFDEFLVNQIKEGATITKEQSDLLQELIQKHFGEKPMVYISNRLMSYTVDPIIYIDAHIKIKNLIAVAIVTQNEMFKKSAEYERTFYANTFEIFPTLSEAIQWVHTVIEDKKKNG